jgi:hypothetical protein
LNSNDLDATTNSISRKIKFECEALIKSIHLDAHLEYFTIIDYLKSVQSLEGCISRLSNFGKTLRYIQLENISFDLRELVNVSKFCPLKLLFLKNCISPLSDPLTIESYNESIGQITKNISETIENIQLNSKFTLPMIFPNSFKGIKILEYSTKLENFEATLRFIFECESLRERLEELQIEIELESDDVQLPSFRFRDNIKSICFGKTMPKLRFFTIKISFELELYEEIDLSERAFDIFRYDPDELNPMDNGLNIFRQFLRTHFPLLESINFPDPKFRE